ncbi:MAG: hypothetical protein JW709_04000 [Sedimentisphaerales bacterium]|nr:hypothetical protein [Sedimentisphaerales bacterium]
MFFNRFYVHPRENGGPQIFSPFGLALRHAAGTLVMLALACIALGIGVLLFPLILAIFVAVLFFFVALVCLGWAWRIYRTQSAHREPTIHVKVSDIEAENDDAFLP